MISNQKDKILNCIYVSKSYVKRHRPKKTSRIRKTQYRRNNVPQSPKKEKQRLIMRYRTYLAQIGK